ncbi:MAG: glutamate--tRNA ligase [Firmicutes bacterium]|nr:glutamate--tRNA ligase [Bacillota bacterium]
MGKIRVRFAPSPTGPLHIGGARSALFNYLLARQQGGTFILRSEDTDLERSSLESERNIIDSLRWLGITWDEGLEVGGEYGPYRQTERLPLYQEYAQKLLTNGQAYYCYCTEEELENERKSLVERGENPRYLGKCRALTLAERQAFERAGRKPTIRFRVPDKQTVVVNDLVRGQVSFESETIGDFVIVKSDGIPTYNYAVVIDDALMKITHVIRGEEHLSNTPRQILLYEALGLPKPEFAHVSLILGKDRSKMSKRHGATSIVAYQEAGYLPEALINFLVLLGWAPPGENEIFSLDELIQVFSLDRVAKNPAVFDLEKLKWLNGHYIRQSSLDRITNLAIPFLKQAGLVEEPITPEKYAWLKLVVEAVRDRLGALSEIVEHVKIFIHDEISLESDEAREVLREEQVPVVLELFKSKLAAMDRLDVESSKVLLKQLTKETKLGGKKVYMPIRVALTGQTHGTDLYYLFPILGRDRCLKRLTYCQKHYLTLE